MDHLKEVGDDMTGVWKTTLGRGVSALRPWFSVSSGTPRSSQDLRTMSLQIKFFFMCVNQDSNHRRIAEAGDGSQLFSVQPDIRRAVKVENNASLLTRYFVFEK